MKKVWTYVSSRELSNEEIARLQDHADHFVKEWTAHENKLAASFSIFKGRILVFVVNEDVHGASGCSIDKLLRFIKQTEQALQVTLLDRMLVALKEGDKVRVEKAAALPKLLESGQLNENTLVYNTAASTGEELDNWEKPLKNTWLSRYLHQA